MRWITQEGLGRLKTRRAAAFWMTCSGLEGVWPQRESQQPRQEMTKLEQRAGHSLWLKGGEGVSDVVLVVSDCRCIVGLELHSIFLAFWVAAAVVSSAVMEGSCRGRYFSNVTENMNTVEAELEVVG